VGRIFFSAAEFSSHSGWIILKRVGNTGRKANKCRKFSYRLFFKGSWQLLWYLFVN